MSRSSPARAAALGLAAVALLTLAPAGRAQQPMGLPWPISVPRQAFAEHGSRGYAPALFGLLARRDEAADLGPMANMLPDNLAAQLTFAGEHALALEQDATFRDLLPASSDGPAPDLGELTARPAVDAILEWAHDRRVVMFNEEHRSARQRAFLHLLLADLRAQGFTHLACETLQEDEALVRRGHPTVDSGSYSRDPVYGELLRRAVELGFQLVRYEASGAQLSGGDGPPDPLAQANRREAAQAENLARVLSDDDARLVVFAGRHHISEGGGEWTPMASLLAADTGLDPLTVDLMLMEPRARAELEHSARRAAVEAGLLGDATSADEPARAVVLVDGDGRAFTSLPGSLDVVVFLPDAREVSGRPEWLLLGGLREVTQAPDDLPALDGPALLQALVVGEDPERAVPADQLVVWPGDAPRPLLLRPGRYTLRLLDAGGQIAWSGALEVEGEVGR